MSSHAQLAAIETMVCAIRSANGIWSKDILIQKKIAQAAQAELSKQHKRTEKAHE